MRQNFLWRPLLMRFGPVLGAILVSRVASCQVEFGYASEDVIKAIHSDPFTWFRFAPNVNVNPVSASKFPVPTKERGQSAPDDLQWDRNKIKIIRGGMVSHAVGSNFKIEQGVVAEFRGYRISADTVEGNRDTQVIVATGHAHIVGSDLDIKGQRVVLDFKNKTFEAFDSDADFLPSFTGGILKGDLYAKSAYSNGSKAEVFGRDSIVTTCDLPDPHYELVARSLDIRPYTRVLMRDVDVYVLKHRLFHLPFLSLPLDQRFYQNLPYVGSDPYEGYFIKTNYGIPLRGPDSLFTRVDLMTKLGLGLGANYVYQKFGGKHPFQGDFGVYGVTGAGSFDLQEDHQAKFAGGTLSISNSYQNNDYLINPGSVALNSRLGYTFSSRAGSSALTFVRNENGSQGFNSLLTSLGLTDTRRWSRTFRTTLRSTYTDSGSSYTPTGGTASSVDRKTVDLSFEADNDWKQVTARLAYQRTIPVGTIQNFYVGSERTPELTLESTSTRLFGPRIGSFLPLQTSLSIGQFSDPSTHSEITRDFFNFNFNKTLADHANRSVFTLGGGFSQGLYSDNTAQYTLTLNGAYGYRLGRDTSLNVRYNYLRPEGFSPLGIDLRGKLNLLTEDLSFRVVRPLLLGLQTGYDSLAPKQGYTAWQPLSLRAEYTPRPWLMMRSLATYDTTLKEFANIRVDLSYRPGGTYVGIGARYDNTRHTWAEVNGFVQALKWGRLKSDILFSFNGYSNQFVSKQLNMTYDLHCAEAVLQIIDNQFGFNNGTQFVFFIRLKAFPFDSGFGAGSRGQSIGTGTGIGY